MLAPQGICESKEECRSPSDLEAQAEEDLDGVRAAAANEVPHPRHSQLWTGKSCGWSWSSHPPAWKGGSSRGE